MSNTLYMKSINKNLIDKKEKMKLTNTSNKKPMIIFISVLLIFVASLLYLDIQLFDIVVGFPKFIAFFVTEFLPPNFENVLDYIPLMIETINYAVLATIFSSCIALLFATLMSKRTNPFKYIRYGVRFFVTLFRNIPVIIMATLLVSIFGIGSISGIIALVLTTLAFLARTFAESLDDIPEHKMEALQSVGATKVQIFTQCVIPNFVPSFLDWSLYSFQINILASVLLGLVGAGGIGMMVQNNIRLFRFHTASAVILIIIIMVVVTELITNKLRKMIK